MTGYTRQSIFTNGDLILAEHGNDEFNQLVSAFSSATGHTHNGSATEGAYVPLISDVTNTNKVQVITGGARTTGDHDVTGNITVGGTVDGRDLVVDGTKLDAIEANATADQIASEVPFTPTGTVTSTDVQSAIAEVAASGGGGGGGSSWTLTEATTGELSAFDMWDGDSSGGAINRNAPTSLSSGDELYISNSNGSADATNTITLGRNGHTINGLAEDLVISTAFGWVRLKYNGTTLKVVGAG